MKCKFEVGQRVVHVPCLGGKINFRKIHSDVTWPKPNGVYTVARVTEGFNPCIGDIDIGVELAELGPQMTMWEGRKVGFLFNHIEFQPVSFLDIDISMFTKMLDSVDA